VLSMKSTDVGSGQYLVVDPLPAGFEIENPDLGGAQGTADLSWLSINSPTHVESRTDQYVAAFRYQSEGITFATAYMVRAVSPGKFVLPGATIEDMYRPELRANTDASTIEIGVTGPASAETAAPASDASSAEASAPASEALSAEASSSSAAQ
jgi:uncharacterized protein YfaS (alpha-2-macroglobulin family)